MANILIIDSSTEACSVALCDAVQTYSHFQIAPRKHAELLLPMVDQILSKAKLELTQLDAIGCCVGPGAFTGLRIAISMAQGLAMASSLPCIGITSLESLAYQAFSTTDADYCLASIDARMDQVYFAVYKRCSEQLVSLVSDPQVIAPESIQLSQDLVDDMRSRVVKAGNGWQAYTYQQAIDELTPASSDILLPQAKYMLDLAHMALENDKDVSPEQLQPLYLRNNVAKKSKTEL